MCSYANSKIPRDKVEKLGLVVQTHIQLFRRLGLEEPKFKSKQSSLLRSYLKSQQGRDVSHYQKEFDPQNQN